MGKRVLSIEIGELKTKLCVMDYQRKHPKVYYTQAFDTPYACMEDGFILNKDRMAQALKEMLKVTNINVTDVIFTISSSRIASHEIVIPMMKQKDIQDYVNAGASDYFPINVSDYVISYIVLEKMQNKQYRLLVIAVHNNLLHPYYEIAKILKLNIVSVDYLSNSILQVIQRQIHTKGTNLYVQINEKNTYVYILNNGIVKLHRTIAYGTGSDEAQSLQYLISNLIRVMEYYSAKEEDRHFESIYLAGSGAKKTGIEDLFRKEINIDIKFINTLRCVNFYQDTLTDKSIQSDYLECIGAAFAPLGLVPKKYMELETKRSMHKELIIIGAFAVAVSLTLITLSTVNITQARAEKRRLEKSIAGMEYVKAYYEENEKLKKLQNEISAIEENCYSRTEELNTLIDELEKKLPTQVTIHSFRSNDQDVLIDVSMDNIDTAAMTFLQLNTIPLITDVRTEQITMKTDEVGTVTLDYIITARYTSPEREGENK